MLIESPNIFHWKSVKKINWVRSLAQYLGQIRSYVVKKNKETTIINGPFFKFCMRNTFKSKK